MNFGLYYPPFHLDKDKSSTVGPRWMEWINGFDLMLNNCCVPEVEKFSLLMRFVGRGVRDICTSLNLEGNAKKDDWFPFAKRALAEHFRKASASNVTFQRYLFAWLRQRSDESFEAFHERVKDVAKSCDFKSDLDRRIRDQIVIGCRSDDIRRQAFLGDHELKDLLQVGRDLQDESDTGLLTSGGDVISVFLPDSAVSLFRVSVASPSSSDETTQASQISQPSTNGTADGAGKPAHDSTQSAAAHRVPAGGVGPSPPRASKGGGHTPDPLSQFDDLSLAHRLVSSATLSKEEKKKERAKERRRQQRKEFMEAIKTKPLEELTDKQRKYFEYQKKLREKWNKRRSEGKKVGFGGGGAPGEGAGGAGAALAAGGVASGSGIDGNDETEDGIKYASDDDDDDEEEAKELGHPMVNTSGKGNALNGATAMHSTSNV